MDTARNIRKRCEYLMRNIANDLFPKREPAMALFFLRGIHMAIYERSVIFMKRKVTIDPVIWKTLTVKQKFWAVVGKILYKVGYLKD